MENQSNQNQNFTQTPGLIPQGPTKFCQHCKSVISAKAKVCPICNKRQKGKPALGCLTVIIALFVIIIGVGVTMSLTMDKVTNQKSGIGKYIDLAAEQSEQIDQVLADCGIEKIDSVNRDELLDNAHVEGETGLRLSSDNVDNIILYLAEDMSVYQIRYSDYDLYANGAKVAVLQDYVVSMDELNKYQYLCQEKVKEVLKAPSTAKFPNFTEWGWKQEMNIFTVQGYVDAKNSFGAEIRSNFQFVIDTNTDTIQSFILDGEELIK